MKCVVNEYQSGKALFYRYRHDLWVFKHAYDSDIWFPNSKCYVYSTCMYVCTYMHTRSGAKNVSSLKNALTGKSWSLLCSYMAKSEWALKKPLICCMWKKILVISQRKTLISITLGAVMKSAVQLFYRATLSSFWSISNRLFSEKPGPC